MLKKYLFISYKKIQGFIQDYTSSIATGTLFLNALLLDCVRSLANLHLFARSLYLDL